MNVNCTSCSTENEKKHFDLKPARKDGLLLQIHHTIQVRKIQKKIRFLYSAFDTSGLIVANADIDGNVFILDFATTKYWCLPKFNSCTVIAFSPLQVSDLIIGSNNGNLDIVNVHSGTISGVLLGHINPVKHISFADDHCLTASLTRAIIFNLKTFARVHELTIEKPTTLKQIFFMPATNNIIACFSDDYIHVWKNKTFESFKKLLPTEWNQFFLKSITITRNGTKMVLAGISTKLIIFSLDTWSLTKILNLPDDITVKSADFISQAHDGGSNKYIILLSSNGIIHFLDMEENIVIRKIHLESEITSFTTSVNGMHLACVLKSGEVNIYKLSHFIEPSNTDCDPGCYQNGYTTNRRKTKLYLQHMKQPKEELNINKLQGILKEYGEYPESYRLIIWSKILLLPNNYTSFTSLMKKGDNKKSNIIDQKYPLVNKNVLKNLKRLLSNLGNWCHLFHHIDFLPLFVFPFVKFFENDPMICLEAVMTIIINWCQHWFEYTPFVPVNILAMIENVLAEHDAQLLSFLTEKGVTSHIYAWPLLETAFSEILTIKEWCILWDHILSNEPAFMLMVPVAYNILCRTVLATLSTAEDFESFYRKQNPIGFQKLISKSYHLLKTTREKNHPRKYLNNFVKLSEGSYPIFEDFSIMLNLDVEGKDETEEKITIAQNELQKYKDEENARQEALKIKEEETKRLQMLEEMCQEKLMKEKVRVEQRKIELSKFKTELLELQATSIENSRKKIEEINFNDRKRQLKRMIRNIEESQAQDDLEIQQTEEDLSKHYVELLKQKTILENMLLQSVNDECLVPEKCKHIEEQREKIRKELEKIRDNVNFKRLENKVNIGYGISIANDRTENIDMALASEMAAKKMNMEKSHGNLGIIKMENDTKDLENDVQDLLDKFTNAKMHEANYLLNHITENICQRHELLKKEKELVRCRCGRNPDSSDSSSSENCRTCCSRKCC